jgi:hypothetical protein
LRMIVTALFFQPLQGIQNRAHASIRPVVRQRPLAQMGYRQAWFLIE